MKFVKIIFTFLILLLLIFQNVNRIGEEQIKIWDESSTSANAVEMLNSGFSIVVPHKGRADHHDTRPPLSVWTKVISYKVFGINEFAARFPSIIASILIGLLLAFFFIYYYKDYLSAIIVLALMATTPGYMTYHVARNGDPDILLMFFTSIYIVFYFILLEKFPESLKKYLFLIGFAVVSGFMTKSIAILAPLAGLVVYTFTQRNGYKLLLNYRFHLTWVISIIIIVSYYIIREQYDVGYIQAVLDQEIFKVGKASGVIKHPERDYYYYYLINNGFKDYFYLLGLSIIPLLFSDNSKKRLILYSLFGAGFYLLGQAFVVMKNEWYISPIYPFFWIIIGLSFSETINLIYKKINSKILKYIIISLMCIGFIALSYPKYSSLLKLNTENLNSGNVYTYERKGLILKEYKELYPETDTLHVFPVHYDRQLRFYILKYEIESNDIITYSRLKPDSLIMGNKYLIQNINTIKLLEDDYNFDYLYQHKYGGVIKIK